MQPNGLEPAVFDDDKPICRMNRAKGWEMIVWRKKTYMQSLI